MKVYLVFYKYHYENKSVNAGETTSLHIREGDGIIPKVFTDRGEAIEAARYCYQDRLDYIISAATSRVSDEFFNNGQFYIESSDGRYYVSGYVREVGSESGREKK